MISTQSGGSTATASILANRDCRVCRRRRIKCDRTLPVCSKCGTRSLQCPGYITSLKWVQVTPPRRKSMSSRRVQLPRERSPSSETSLDICAEVPASEGVHQVDEMASDRSPHNAEHRLILQPDYTPGICHHPSARELLHHYTNVVAAQMVWVDSTQNPFRKIIIPLAMQSPALMLSIFSVAAGDIWSRSGQTFDCSFDSLHLLDKYRGQTLTHLVDHLKVETAQGLHNPPDLAVNDRVSPILAAFLLSSLGIKLNDSSAWRLHLRAAWSMVEHWNTCFPNTTLSTSGVKEFLLQEMYFCKVWESVTTFQSLSDTGGTSSLFNIDGPFIQYLGIISTLADIERSSHAGRCEEVRSGLTMSTLIVMFDEARRRSKNYANTITFRSPGARAAFEYVVDLHHHAGVLYGSHVLSDDGRSSVLTDSSRVALFQYLHKVTGPEIIAQDLTWPVFIAGIECHGRVEYQRLVCQKMQDIMRMSGELERPRLVSFLADFWFSQGQGSKDSWTKLARAYASRGTPIIIL
ncbi:fungal-specific transcription factor domain-containing protein [Exophiala viscosa]|uniref:Fungal-specific transcription factor domain-containing protein n=1 Tax=Exophiala viscosa TaxID=2486360 RepID=A0AAN6DTB9_9EURO|nr:fungal-specific transcription factor domain-containing protein [Exophiala viscosa]KAI1623894.1 fungal-specific transcription factor domain-containing protein [Exophiala viscosa]